MENLVEKTSSSLVDNLRPFLESYIKNHMKTIVKNQETEKENYEYMLNLPIVMELNKKIVMMRHEIDVKDSEIEVLKQALKDAKNRIDLVIKEKNVENDETLEQKQESIEQELKMKLLSTSLYNNDYMKLNMDDEDNSTDEDKYTTNNDNSSLSTNIYGNLKMDCDDDPDNSESSSDEEDDCAYNSLKVTMSGEIKCVKVDEPAGQEQAEQSEVEEEQAEQSEVEEEQAEQSEVEEEQAEQSEVEEEQAEQSEEEEELYDIVIDGKTYCTDNDLEGNVWELIETDEGDEIGDLVGRHKNGKWVNYSN
jgi:hypothetical protein